MRGEGMSAAGREGGNGKLVACNPARQLDRLVMCGSLLVPVVCKTLCVQIRSAASIGCERMRLQPVCKTCNQTGLTVTQATRSTHLEFALAIVTPACSLFVCGLQLSEEEVRSELCRALLRFGYSLANWQS